MAKDSAFIPTLKEGNFTRRPWQSYELNGGYDAEKGNAAIQESEADLISYGSLFLANPDLPERFKRNAPLNAPDIATFYAGEEKGYIDYPAL